MDTSKLANKISQPDLVPLIHKFLQDQLHPNSDSSTSTSLSAVLPFFDEPISVYPSAVATFYAPSDLCGTQGMCHECICAVEFWRRGHGCYNCVFVNTDPAVQGMLGLDIAHVCLFFSLTFCGKFYQCPLVHWFYQASDGPDEDTGMWIVHHDCNTAGSPTADVLHLDTLVHTAHLIGIYWDKPLPKDLSSDQSLNIFWSYYVNKYIDHHGYEIAF